VSSDKVEDVTNLGRGTNTKRAQIISGYTSMLVFRGNERAFRVI